MTRERKWILIIGGILLTLGLIIRFMPENVSNDASELEFNQKMLAKYREQAAGKDALQAQLSAVERALGRAEASLLAGGTPALAAVDIQNQLSSLAQDLDIRIERMRIISAGLPRTRDRRGRSGNTTQDTQDAPVYVHVPVEVAFKCDILQLRDLLYRLETSDKLLAVTSLRVRRLSGKRGSSPLSVQLTLEGLMKPVGEV